MGLCIYEYNQNAKKQIIDDILSDAKMGQELNKWAKKCNKENEFWKKVWHT